MDSEGVREHEKKLYKEEKWKELFEYLQNIVASNSDPDLAWRFLRCGFRYGQQLLTDGDTKGAERIADTAMERGEKALKENDRNFGLHKWTGVLLRLIGDIKGTRVKIENSHRIREHFTKALEIQPGTPDVGHLLGRWCFHVASVTWLERKMASTFLASPPTATYEEAFSYFNSAEESEPGFFMTNWLWMGKTLVKLRKKGEAKHWLQKMAEAEVVTVDDKEAKKEAAELLKTL